ncbi:U-scoloptoxin(01)-Er1a-like [Centruroides vittatus]|uniref:U-scoloptoxin(01)-Er1a-like n=1 Tax=Centruroides vittatus TaxID=120091 RepID=UPI00351013AC
MIKIVLLLVSCLALTSALPRTKRQAYALPDGVELLIGSIKTSFTCSGDGYFADVENNCQIFHVCQTVVREDGSPETYQWSFMCGNQTIFNQYSLTCADPYESVPCGSARDFFYVNGNIGNEKLPFLTDDDADRAARVIPGRQGVPAEPAPFRPGGSGGRRG